MSDPISALIGGLFNVAGAVTGGLFGNAQQKQEQNFNAEQAQLNRDFQTSERLAAQEFDLDMWNLNNDYNDIGSQIARARSAGVNPAVILGGDYKPAQASPVTTSPMSGATASTNNAGALGSSMISAGSNILSNVGGFMNNYAQAKNTNAMITYNQDLIKSQIDANFATVEKFAHDNGLTDVNAELVRKTVGWMDGLNLADITLKKAQATKLYNDNYETYQRILESQQRIKASEQDIKESESRIGVNESLVDYHDVNADYVSSLKDHQETVNKYADSINSSLATQEEMRATEAKCRKDFAETYNIPLGSSEFEFAWALQLKGKYEEYCNNCIQPASMATWKPADYAVLDYSFGKANTKYFWNFNRAKGVFNPSYGDYTPAQYWKDYYKTMAEIDAIRAKYRKKYNKKK